VKEQEKAARKLYAIDVGLANAIGFRFSSNLGRIAENLVAIELRREERLGNIEIYYWQDVQKREVDFIVKKEQKIKQLIQVCWNIDEYKTKEREVKALLKASKELKCKNLLVITEDNEGEEKVNNKNIKYLPLWKWLLQSRQARVC
ncbi:ATP-binding protein, partial [Candidatus Kuenenbacteria bacterium]|nr:ATP-binding protein [Candidatus Kuenenbacteria bacterium]